MHHNHGKTTTSRPLYLTKQTIALTFLISLTPAISYADASAQYSLQESVTVTGVSGYSIIGDLVYTTNSASQVNTVSGNGTNTYNSLTYTPSTNTDATTNSSKVGFSFADTAAITYPTSNNLSSSASSSSSVNENLFITNNSGAAQNVAITYNVLGGVDTYTYQQSSTLLSSAVIAASAITLTDISDPNNPKGSNVLNPTELIGPAYHAGTENGVYYTSAGINCGTSGTTGPAACTETVDITLNKNQEIEIGLSGTGSASTSVPEIDASSATLDLGLLAGAIALIVERRRKYSV